MRKKSPAKRLRSGPRLYSDNDYKREKPPRERGSEGEPEKYRSDARRDYARLIHSPAFRRLQGKMQLFPGWESDFFRNRLTHSLEVAQVGESLAYKCNQEIEAFIKDPIDPRIVAFAGLAHDLGHPPFGHNGEKALDDCMMTSGGFEGNAQTLRILAKLEKKEADPEVGIEKSGDDRRVGLNLTYRSMASVLKYDRKIPLIRKKSSGLVKGYYASEAGLVQRIKKAVAPRPSKQFKTIECHLMDLADDISYSTYDLEDSLKAGFLNPLEILASSDEILDRVASAVSQSLSIHLERSEVLEVLVDTFAETAIPDLSSGEMRSSSSNGILLAAVEGLKKSKNYADVGHLRNELTSDLVSQFIVGVQIEPNDDSPALSTASFDGDTLLKVEVLKRFTYEATIMSPRLKVAEYRGYSIVRDIFEGLTADDGVLLLPDDFREVHRAFPEEAEKRRVISDFIAGMTDRYALEFYSRLKGENPQSIFKPF